MATGTKDCQNVHRPLYVFVSRLPPSRSARERVPGSSPPERDVAGLHSLISIQNLSAVLGWRYLDEDENEWDDKERDKQ